MASSRIFVKNLPSSLSTEDFRRHFSQTSPVTDAKYLPHRRLGYVGYKTAEDALRAVKFYNKSFFGMARLAVENAQTISERQAASGKRNRASRFLESKDLPSEPAAQGSHLPNSKDAAEKEAKFQEYLQVMRPASHVQTWANHDQDSSLSTRPAQQTVNETKILQGNQSQSEEEYEEIPQKRSKKEDSTSDVLTRPSEGMRNVTKTPIASEDGIIDSSKPSNDQNVSSDADWLRSRKSRVLDLEEGDEEERDEIIEFGNDPISKLENEATMDNTNEASTPQFKDAATPAEPVIPNVSPVRLFARNLPYTATVDDLSKHVESLVGELPTEVRCVFPRGQILRAILIVMRPQIGTAYAMHMMYYLKSVVVDASVLTEKIIHTFDLLELGGKKANSQSKINLPTNSRNGQNKGYAHIQFRDQDICNKALSRLDQIPFQGRLLHLMQSHAKPTTEVRDLGIAKLPLKKQQQVKRKLEATSSTFNWNALYMNVDAVLASISERLKVPKAELLDPTSSSAAITQAHAETHVIQETKSYFKQHGVDLEAFKANTRGNTSILIKNFPFGTSPEELRELFGAHGSITKFLMPPAGTVAIIEFERAEDCKTAFSSLAYRKFKDSVLFLEKGPQGLFNGPQSKADTSTESTGLKPVSSEVLALDTSASASTFGASGSATLFVRNLNFTTTSAKLTETFKPLAGFLSAKVKTRVDPKKPNQVLSMGFGFLEFQDIKSATDAMAAMNGYKLEQHQLLIRAAKRNTDTDQSSRAKQSHPGVADIPQTKIVVKNLPFETTKKDVRALLSAYGQVRAIRLPKKFGSAARGFAFADFATAREAANAMEALRDTHLLGRRLVLDYAAADNEDPEEEISRMQEKMGQQSDRVALQRVISASSRKKFTDAATNEDAS